MSNFFQETLALPLRAADFIASYASPGKTGSLRKLIWQITGEAKDAENYLSLLYKDDLTSARSEADDILREKNDGEYYNRISYLDMRTARNPEQAKKWVAAAHQRGCANEEMLLYMDLVTAESEDELKEVTEKILSRNDLPGHYTKLALIHKITFLIYQHYWEEAEVLTNRVLEIEEDRGARIFKLAISIWFGRDDIVKQKRYLQSGDQDRDNLAFAHAYLYAGKLQESKDHLDECSTDLLKSASIIPELRFIANQVIMEKENA
ncbi:MAG: hypothetical protein ACLFR1_08535 [Spirochaetia bacterium]